MDAQIRARIDADMASAAAMSLAELLGFLDGYSARFDREISCGVVTRGAVRAYADDALRAALDTPRPTA